MVEVPRKGRRPFSSTANSEWLTPSVYIEAAREVLGNIDLDPCSTTQANEIIQADEYFTKEENGLLQEWHGRVWMHPPYTNMLIERFIRKMLLSYKDGEVEEAVILTNNATETAWFRKVVNVAPCMVFVTGRIDFINPEGGIMKPLLGQVVIYLGKDPVKFMNVFSKFGWGCWTDEESDEEE
jgi:phage N-6-adenine-methyltransferase